MTKLFSAIMYISQTGKKTVVIAYVFKLHCDDIFGRHVDSLNIKNVTKLSNSICMFNSSSPSTNQSPSDNLDVFMWYYKVILYSICHITCHNVFLSHFYLLEDIGHLRVTLSLFKCPPEKGSLSKSFF